MLVGAESEDIFGMNEGKGRKDWKDRKDWNVRIRRGHAFHPSNQGSFNFFQNCYGESIALIGKKRIL
jgi:hypothetical protein